MMEKRRFDRKSVAQMYLMTSLLVLWTIVAAAMFALLDLNETALLGWALTGFVILTSLARPFKGAGILAIVLAVVVFFGVQFDRILNLVQSGIGLSYLPHAFIGTFCFAIAGLLGGVVARRFLMIETQLEESAKIIDELTLYDTLTGTLKSVYGDKVLSEEIERSRRYDRPLSLVLLDADDWIAVVRERGKDGAMEALRVVSNVLMHGLRSIDTRIRYSESRFAIILPETKAEGA